MKKLLVEKIPKIISFLFNTFRNSNNDKEKENRSDKIEKHSVTECNASSCKDQKSTDAHKHARVDKLPFIQTSSYPHCLLSSTYLYFLEKVVFHSKPYHKNNMSFAQKVLQKILKNKMCLRRSSASYDLFFMNYILQLHLKPLQKYSTTKETFKNTDISIKKMAEKNFETIKICDVVNICEKDDTLSIGKNKKLIENNQNIPKNDKKLSALLNGEVEYRKENGNIEKQPIEKPNSNNSADRKMLNNSNNKISSQNDLPGTNPHHGIHSLRKKANFMRDKKQSLRKNIKEMNKIKIGKATPKTMEIKTRKNFKSVGPRQRKVTRLVTIIIVAYAFCWLPYNISQVSSLITLRYGC